ncbi:MAG: MotA/TolQ/ExbB proton channel family protein, partial [Cyanobacteria bacterium P01_G01_bin.49]
MRMKTQEKNQYLLTSGDSERKKLDVNFWLVSIIALVVAVAVYAIALSVRTTFIGVLLYERGLTQYLVIYLASIVVSLTVIKLIKLQKESIALRRSWVPQTVTFDNPHSRDLFILQKNLAKQNKLLPIRCSRVLTAYIQSGSRKTAAELSLDDSTFYLSASESSYTFPRILVWAIPLLGFIGTVIGISQAVNGFSGFLEQAGEIEQIKEGIGTVTSGLAVAFDTTLLALLLSVLVMIPLVLV